MRKLASLRTFALLAFLIAASAEAAFAQVTVKVTSPTSTTVSTAFTLTATASSPNGMSGWYIYVDNAAVWNTPGPASSIAAPLTLTVGTHNVVVRAWDNAGAYSSANLSLKVVQSTVPVTTVTSTAPANGATLTNPVTFNASATSPNGISGWVIYCDNQNVYQADNYSNTLSTSLSLPVGAHTIYIRGWDNVSGYGTSTPVSINVVQSQPTPPPPTGTTASVSSPLPGASVNSPVVFKASGTSPNGISGWVIYANNQNVYQVDNNSNNLTASVNLAPGTYSVYIRAWDNISGYGTSAPFQLTVGTPPSPLPTPPANAVVFTNIEDTSNWQWCSDCAGPATVTTDFWTAPFQTTPALDGSSRQFYVGGPPWTAALWWHTVQSSYGQFDYATHFLWDFWFYVDSASMQNVWTLEFDLYQVVGGYEYMIGSHCSFGEGYWYGWSQNPNYWVKTNVPCNTSLLGPDKWHHIQWMVERIPNSTNFKYDTLVVDGTAYTLNLVEPAGPIDWANVLGVQWQIDTNSNGGAAHEWVDKASLTVW